MQTIESPSLADHVRTLPSKGPGRDRQLLRIIDLHAAAEAAGALHAIATGRQQGVAGDISSAADTLLAGMQADRGSSVDAATALERLRDAVTSPELMALLPEWIGELRAIASSRPDSGACTIASALELWAWTMKHFRTGDGARWGSTAAQAVDELSEVFCSLVAARALVLEVPRDKHSDAAADLRRDLSQVYAARSSAQTGTACAELVFGFRRHLTWDAEGCASCYDGEAVDDVEAMIPGIAAGIRMNADVIESDGSHQTKRGPCVRFEDLDGFTTLRNKLDGCLTGARLAKERAVAAIENSMASMVSSKPIGEKAR